MNAAQQLGYRAGVKRLSRSEPRRTVSDSVNAAPISCCAKWVTETFQLCGLPSYQHTHSDTVCATEKHNCHTQTHTHTLRQQCWLSAAVLGEFLRNPRSLLLTEMFCNRVFLLKCISICAGKGEATANADIINQNGLGHIYRERKAKKNTHVTLNMISLHVSLLSKRQSWTSFVLNQLVS